MNDFFNLINQIEQLNGEEQYIVQQKLEALWTKLYLYEKGHKKQVTTFFDRESNASIIYKEAFKRIEKIPYFITDFHPIEKLPVFSIEELRNFRDKDLTDSEMTAILDTVVAMVREYLLRERYIESIEKDSYIDCCKIASNKIHQYLGKYLNACAYPLHTTDIIGPHIQHFFNFVVLPHVDGNGRAFLIDSSYRQFFTIATCNPYRIYHYENVGVNPGYFMVDENVSRQLIEKGYIDCSFEAAKAYGDSFFLANLSCEKRTIPIIITTSIPGENYHDSFFSGTMVKTLKFPN